jgi:Uma2 family endonuclease
MNWTEVISHPELRDLPFKIETNRYGQIVMSPASNRHGLFQSAIDRLIGQLKLSGYVQFECAVETEDGVKVADVAWYSDEFYQNHRDEVAYSAAPELFVEVLSPSNSSAEINEKTRLYFQHGAHEVWICDANGKMRFMTSRHELAQSELFPDFPVTVEIR